MEAKSFNLNRIDTVALPRQIKMTRGKSGYGILQQVDAFTHERLKEGTHLFFKTSKDKVCWNE